MTTYRRKIDGDVWHWCTNCTDWPASDYEEKHSSLRPTTAELCAQCLARTKAGTCKETKNSDFGG